MKKMRSLFLFILLASSKYGFGQKPFGSISGRILNADGSPAYVTIELRKLGKIAVTDNNGYFKLSHLPGLRDTLLITSVESQTYSQLVVLERDQKYNLGDIHLSYNIGQLHDVEVTGRVSKSYKSDYSYLATKTETPVMDIPQSISTITKERIKDKMDFTLKDAVNQVAGVNDYSGFDEFSIRGFLANNAHMINGLRGYSTTYTTNMLTNIERIEVIKGPTATLYANCDPGGTINLVTKKPLSQPAAELDVSGGTWDHFRAEGDITGPLNKDGTLLYRFNAGYDNKLSFRDLLYSKSYEFAPSLSYIPNERLQVNIDFSLSHINTILDRGQPGFLDGSSLRATPIGLIASQPGNFLHETDIAANALLSYKINNHISFNSGFLNYQTRQEVAEHGVQGYITNDSVYIYYSNWDYRSATNTFSNYFICHFNTGKFSHQLILGYDYVKSTVNLSQNYYEIPDQFGLGSGIVGTFSLKHPVYANPNINSYQLSDYSADASAVNPSVYHTEGGYLQEQIGLGKWKMLIGLRQEAYRADGNQEDSSQEDIVNIFLPRVGLVYELRPNLSLYGTYNQGFDPFEASSSTQVFNVPFKPVTSELFEIGAKMNWLNNKLATSLAIYQLTLRNVAVNANVISNPNLYIQQGEDRSRGVELEANGNILPNLSVSFSYAHCIAKVIRSVVLEQEGTIVENSPRNASSSLIKYTFNQGALKGFGIMAGHTQASVRNTLTSGLTLPGYVALNAGLHYESKHINFALNLNNITNAVYWIGAYNNVNKWPGAPRNFMFSAGLRL
jgi:iron complex outermembrane receptor protein